MKQILLYNPIYDFIAEEFITAINDADGEDITIRINSPGGSVFAGWGMAAAIQESKSKVTIKVDGVAASMAFFLLLFCDNVEALDVSKIMMHRAVGRVENEADQALLDSVNSTLRAKMEERFDENTFKDIVGISINDMFTQDTRKDLWIDAKQAKKIGLVSKINRLSPIEQRAMSKMVADSDIAASIGFIEEGKSEPEADIDNIINYFKTTTKWN